MTGAHVALLLAVVVNGSPSRAEPCRAVATWQLAAEVARAPGALEALAALAVWGPTATDPWEAALRALDAAGIDTTVTVEGRRVRLTLSADNEADCALATRIAALRQSATWTDDDAARVRAWPLARLAPTRLVPEQALMARAALGAGDSAPFSLAPMPSTPWRPGRRAEDTPEHNDGRARLALAWSLGPDQLGLAAAAAADLAHPGGPLVSRLTAHGMADHVIVTATAHPPALVILVATRDPRAARDRVLRELEAYEVDPRPAALAAFPEASDAAELERFVRRFARLPPSEVLQAAPARAGDVNADADDIQLFVRASVDLRCPAPGEARDSAALLEEKHGLDAARYLALSRALGRDAERFQGIDLEVRDRCAERGKLSRMMAPARVVQIYKAIRCLKPPASEAAVFSRFDLDPSALGPLVALVREEPRHALAIADIERQCPRDTPQEAP